MPHPRAAAGELLPIHAAHTGYRERSHFDGQDCLDAYLPIWGCLAASCNDPACSVDPQPDSCLCTEAEDALAAACPNLGG